MKPEIVANLAKFGLEVLQILESENDLDAHDFVLDLIADEAKALGLTDPKADVFKSAVPPLSSRDALADSMLIQAAPAMLDVLRRLRSWEERMGGWEASCWEDARRVLAQIEGPEEPVTELD